MKNPERVAELLAALKNECEYRFESDAVAVLAQTVSALPRVTVIDDTHQEFLGKIYYENKHDNHYVCGNKQLHRVVWSYYYGEIPKGYVIHHIDENPANNNIENLQCMSRLEHGKIHGGRHLKGKPMPNVERICKHCGKSFVGKHTSEYCSKECCYAEWHEKRYTESVCEVCGKTYMRFDYNHGNVCSKTCAGRKAHAAYMKRHSKT